ncbi:thermonuclease family protein [Shimia sp. SDUM112013]|uniref:thermonuclease family protein n=1 Tax=Shimia sp. SDUM112013 TaxID=3136160 RepID=UPI0032F04FFC
MLKIIIRALFGVNAPKQKKAKSVYSPTPYVRRAPRKDSSTKAVPPQKTASHTSAKSEPALETTLTGKCYVVDGDTIRIGKVSLRLAGIDAPELEHPWGKKAKWELVHLCKGKTITAEIEPELSYDRVVATCYLPDGTDLSAEMVRRGMALDWPKFSGGKYANLEPDGMRKKHWKAAARQRGHMHVFNK